MTKEYKPEEVEAIGKMFLILSKRYNAISKVNEIFTKGKKQYNGAPEDKWEQVAMFFKNENTVVPTVVPRKHFYEIKELYVLAESKVEQDVYIRVLSSINFYENTKRT